MVRISGIAGAICLLLASLATPVAAKGVATNHAAAQAFKVGVVLDVGGVNDKSFNHLAFEGFTEAERDYKGVQGYYVTSHSQADYVPNLTYFAQQHFKL